MKLRTFLRNQHAFCNIHSFVFSCFKSNRYLFSKDKVFKHYLFVRNNTYKKFRPKDRTVTTTKKLTLYERLQKKLRSVNNKQKANNRNVMHSNKKNFRCIGEKHLIILNQQ